VGKLRVLLEPFAPGPPAAREESVAELLRRRVGAEALTRLGEALVTGIYAGDAARLSARHALPRLVALERAYGSLLVGGLRAARAARRRRAVDDVDDDAGPPRRAISFVDGLATLPTALAAALGRRVALGAAVRAVAPRPGGGWRVAWRGADGADGATDVDAVVLAVPAHALSAIDLPPPVRRALAPVAAVRHAPVATLTLAFRRADVAHALDGFGMLVPPGERTTLRGVLFTSSLFAGRCPPGEVLLTCFAGGTTAPEAVGAAAAALVPRVLAELRALLGARGEPRAAAVARFPQGIPQYEVGHGAVVAAAARVERAHPGLVLAGSWRDGVAVGACVAGGTAAAARAARAAGVVAEAATRPSRRRRSPVPNASGRAATPAGC
jgi:oxygen-dependent protoporphyrinogen oxidase